MRDTTRQLFRCSAAGGGGGRPTLLAYSFTLGRDITACRMSSTIWQHATSKWQTLSYVPVLLTDAL